jgi:hypothetical protein
VRDGVEESLDARRLRSRDLLRSGRSWYRGSRCDGDLDSLVSTVVSLADGVTEDLSDIGHGDEEKGFVGGS